MPEYCLKAGYRARSDPHPPEGETLEAGDSGLTDLGRLARDLSGALGCRALIVLGWRRPGQLAALEGERELIALDRLSHLEAARWVVPEAELIEWDPEGGDPPPVEPERLRGALLVCDGLLERLGNPLPLLTALRELLSTAPAAILATAERDIAHGAAHAGPPPDPRHVREWNASELDALLESQGLEREWMGLARSPSEPLDRSALLVALGGTRATEVARLLETGARSVAFDPEASPPVDGERDGPLRVAIASSEVLGPTRMGGIGTAYSSLAEAFAEAGHEVSLLYTGWGSDDNGPFSKWVAHYEQLGIELADLRGHSGPEVHTPHYNAEHAYKAYLWLRDRDRKRPFDVIHFPESPGHGYYTVLAKRQGWAFQQATIVVSTQSPTEWIAEAHRAPFEDADQFAKDFAERECVALADVVVGPSAYMVDWAESRGWRLPRRVFAQQHMQPRSVRDLAESTKGREASSAGIRELVFFGRLEPRKGLALFCDAIDLMAADDPDRELAVTFLGKPAEVDGRPADVYGRPALEFVAERASRWPWSWRALDQFSQPEAVSYLKAGGGSRLAVMPSLVENGAYTVLEALGLEIPFIASRVGGMAELIHPLDLERCSFDPRERRSEEARGSDLPPRLDPTSLARKLAEALDSGSFPPARSSVDPTRNKAVYMRWHKALRRSASARETGGTREEPAPAREPRVRVVVGGDGEERRRTIASLQAQDHRNLAVAETDSLEAEERNATAGAAPADYLLFLAPGAVARPECVSSLLGVAIRTGADVVTCVSERDRSTLRVPVGGPPLIGLFSPAFGEDAYLVRRLAFDALDGFSAMAEPGSEDDELLCRAALADNDIAVIPEPLVEVGGTPREPRPATPLSRRPLSMVSAQRAYQAHGRDHHAALVMTAQALWKWRSDLYVEVGRLSGESQSLRADIAELQATLDRHVSLLQEVITSDSWRLTAPFRHAGKLARQVYSDSASRLQGTGRRVRGRLSSEIRDRVPGAALGLGMAKAIPRMQWRGDSPPAVRRALRSTVLRRIPAEERLWVSRIEAWRRELAGKRGMRQRGLIVPREGGRADVLFGDRAFGFDAEGLPIRSSFESDGEVPLSAGEYVQEAAGFISAPAALGLFLMRLVRELAPNSCLELGTGFGISGAYQAAALELNGRGTLTTLDGADAWARVAAEGFSKLGLDRRIRVRVGPLRETLGEEVVRADPIDFAFVDANHEAQPTLDYFDAMLPHLAPRAVTVFDDIDFFDMPRAWEAITRSPHVVSATSFGRIGVCVVSAEPREFSLVSGAEPSLRRFADDDGGSAASERSGGLAQR